MFNKKLLAASMSAAISVGLVAEVSAMQVSAKNQGQVLLAPLIWGSAGVQTDMVVVNTRTDAAVKAKVVFRSNQDSKECLDFYIWLSPSDTWRGQLSDSGTAGQALLTSDDDSILVNSAGFAVPGGISVSQQMPDLSGLDNPRPQSCDLMHMEVFSVQSASIGTYSDGTAASEIVVKEGIVKSDLRKVLQDDGTTNLTVYAAATGATNTCGNVTSVNGLSSINACNTMISGTNTIRFDGTTDVDERMSMVMTAFEPTDYTVGTTGTGAAPIDTANQPIENSAFATSIIQGSTETGIGPGFGVAGSDLTHNYEAAIATSTVGAPYEAAAGETSTGTINLTTYPTRYRHYGNAVDFGCSTSVAGRWSAPFEERREVTEEDSGTKEWIAYTTYNPVSCDNSENCTSTPTGVFSGLPGVDPDTHQHEINLYVLGNIAASGWNRLDYTNITTGCGYTGVPALNSVIKLNDGANLLWEKSFWR